MLAGAEGAQVPVHLCMLSTKLLPTFPHIYAFNISYLFVCRFGLTHRGRQTHTHARTQVLRLLLLAIHISWAGEKEGLSRRSADRRRRGSADVLNFIDKFNVSVTFRYATSAYSVCGARSIGRSEIHRRSLYPCRSAKCLFLCFFSSCVSGSEFLGPREFKLWSFGNKFVRLA